LELCSVLLCLGALELPASRVRQRFPQDEPALIPSVRGFAVASGTPDARWRAPLISCCVSKAIGPNPRSPIQLGMPLAPSYPIGRAYSVAAFCVR